MAIAAFGLAPVHAPAVGQTPTASVVLRIGEEVTISPSGDAEGLFTILERRLVVDETESAPPPDNAVRFRLDRGFGGGTMLRVDNGTSRTLRYRAAIGRGRSARRTTTCDVLPHIGAFEMWPERIGRLEISRIQLSEPPAESDGGIMVSCGYR